MSEKIIGYHGTKEKIAKTIVNDGFKIAKKKDTDNHWLGHGIYFYSDYELALWWAKTKVDKHNKKYGQSASPIVIKSEIQADEIWDLDNPFRMRQFNNCKEKLEKEFVNQGVKLDFTKGDARFVKQRKRCFWMDVVKEQKNIAVLMYTFTKANPSYIKGEYHSNEDEIEKHSLSSMELSYHEKQICVTNNQYIVDKCIIKDEIENFDEVIV